MADKNVAVSETTKIMMAAAEQRLMYSNGSVMNSMFFMRAAELSENNGCRLRSRMALKEAQPGRRYSRALVWRYCGTA